MAISRSKPKLVASNSIYIDPLNCDSTISYKVVDGPRSTWGNVQLADCNRKIEWYFGTDEPIEKIDNAIKVLEEFRKSLIEAKANRIVRKVIKRKVKNATLT